MDVNWSRRQIHGKEQELQAILQQIHAATLFQLLFTHCPHLQGPPIIRRVNHLGELDIYNCTVDQWNATSSLHIDHHPELNYVSVFRSRLPAIPNGLVDKNSPSHVSVLCFYDTNLTNLPENLHESWSTVSATIVFEFSKLDHFASTPAEMQ